jgi:hypothetical protein
MAITLEADLEAKLRERADAAGISLETYLARIALDDDTAEAELESLAIEGINSGESVTGDEHYWARKRQRLINRHAR